MRYKMIAADLDDTLLDHNSKLTARSKEAIRRAIAGGIRFVIATGRMFKTSLPYMEEIDPGGDCPMINYHGALIKTARSKRVILHRPLANDLARALAKEAEVRGCHVSVFIDDSLYIDSENKMSRYYQSIAGIELEEVGDLSAFLARTGASPSKMSIIRMDGGIDVDETHFRQVFGSRINALQSRPFFLEITDSLASKGQALQWLASREGIERDEIIAFGDGHNDLDMLRYAGLGVAVANARPEVIAQADLVAAANTEDGVAKVIEEHILGDAAAERAFESDGTR